jgi:hypothetical protein
MIRQYVRNTLVAFDQLVNALLLGDPDETISSRLGKWARNHEHKRGLRKPIWIVVNFVCERFETNHFEKSIEVDEGNDGIVK